MAKMNVKSLITNDYRKNDVFAAKKTNPIQTQTNPISKQLQGQIIYYGKRLITDREVEYQTKCAFENSYRSFGCEGPAEHT